MRTFDLTPKEAEILNHRLETPDCIAEVFGPHNDNVWSFVHQEDVNDRVEELIAEVFTDRPNGGMTILFNPDNADHRLILDEVIDGNVMKHIVQDMLEMAPDEPDRIEGNKWLRAMRSLDKKFESAGLKGFGL